MAPMLWFRRTAILFWSMALGLPKDWRRLVNEPMHETELEAIRRSIPRGQPYGDAAWNVETAAKLGLEFTMRPRGRPSKKVNESINVS
jgi:hypothetical protein